MMRLNSFYLSCKFDDIYFLSNHFSGIFLLLLFTPQPNFPPQSITDVNIVILYSQIIISEVLTIV